VSPARGGTGGSREHPGARTSSEGTPESVDLERDRRSRTVWTVFLIGPVTWFAHFMLVYLLAEAGCTGDGPGLELLGPPVPATVTLVATVIAVAICLAATRWGLRWWRETRGPDPATTSDAGTGPGLEDEPHEVWSAGSLAFAGALLSALSALAVIFVALPALWFPGC